jgi:DNA-binding NtrC family response regulator
LENVLERIVLLGRFQQVTLEELPEQIRSLHTPPAPKEETREAEPSTTLESVERQLIVEALRRFGWNQSRAARHLRISRKTLMYRIAKYGIEKEDEPRPEQRSTHGSS